MVDPAKNGLFDGLSLPRGRDGGDGVDQEAVGAAREFPHGDVETDGPGASNGKSTKGAITKRKNGLSRGS